MEQNERNEELKQKLLSGLNDAQRAAVEYIDGPQLVIACAGSGKTRVLTYKIAYLLCSGYDASRILAMTFTRKAANEMKERIDVLCDAPVSKQLVMGTFHSVFARILRIEHSAALLQKNFVIYDQTDSVYTVTDIIKNMGLSLMVYRPKDIHGRISSLKNNKMYDASAYKADKDEVNEDTLSGHPRLGDIFDEYEKRLEVAGAVDFDDILLRTFRMFESNPETAEKWRSHFQYILVDEYQDTNTVQDKIVRMLANTEEKVCVVGDDAQSIYAFRGAVIGNILNFHAAYPSMKMFKLEENYRSTPEIIEAANCVIGTNKNQIRKAVFTENPSGEKVRVVRVLDKFEESSYITKFIKKDMEADKERKFDDYTILYRMNSQSAQMESEFRQAKIPYRIYGSLSFFQREEIKNLLAYLKLAVNPSDDESFKRIFDYPSRRIADVTLSVIQKEADLRHISLFDTIRPESGINLVFTNKGYSKRVSDFHDRIKGYSEYAAAHTPVETTKHIFEDSGMKAIMEKDKTEQGLDRLHNIDELIDMERKSMVSGITTLGDFVAEVMSMGNEDEPDKDEPKVRMMTLHGSKGLEFHTVFILGCIEGLFPMVSNGNFKVDEEEECRLAYVGMTRAKKRLILPVYDEYSLWGNTKKARTSRFIDAVRPDLKEVELFGTIASRKNSESIIMQTQYGTGFRNTVCDEQMRWFDTFSKEEQKEYLKKYENFKKDSFSGTGQMNMKLYLNRTKSNDFMSAFLRDLLEIGSCDANTLKYRGSEYSEEHAMTKNDIVCSLIKRISRDNEEASGESEKIRFSIFKSPVKDTGYIFLVETNGTEERRYSIPIRFTIPEYQMKEIGALIGDAHEFTKKLDWFEETEDSVVRTTEKYLKRKTEEIRKRDEFMAKISRERQVAKEAAKLMASAKEGKQKKLPKIEKFLKESQGDTDMFGHFKPKEISQFCAIKNPFSLGRIIINVCADGPQEKIARNNCIFAYELLNRCKNDYGLYLKKGNGCFYVLSGNPEIPGLKFDGSVSKKKESKTGDATPEEIEKVRPFGVFLTAFFRKFLNIA